MEQSAAYDSPNPNLLPVDTRVMLSLWWLSALSAIILFGLLAPRWVPRITRDMQRIRENDAFLAQSVIGEGTVTSCHVFIKTHVFYEYVPAGYGTTKGVALYQGMRGCSGYPVGSTLPIRYLPAEPARSEGLNEPDSARQILNEAYFGIIQHSLLGVFLGWMAVRLALLRYRGRLRQGRILRVIRIWGDSWTWVIYLVPDDQEKWRFGFRLISGTTIDPAAQKGSPIAVLYAGKHIHMPVRSLV